MFAWQHIFDKYFLNQILRAEMRQSFFKPICGKFVANFPTLIFCERREVVMNSSLFHAFYIFVEHITSYKLSIQIVVIIPIY